MCERKDKDLKGKNVEYIQVPFHNDSREHNGSFVSRKDLFPFW